MKVIIVLTLMIFMGGCKPSNEEILNKYFDSIDKADFDALEQSFHSDFLFFDFTDSAQLGYKSKEYSTFIAKRMIMNGQLSYSKESIFQLGDTISVTINYKDDYSRFLEVEHPPVRQIFVIPNGLIETIAQDSAIGYKKLKTDFDIKLNKFKSWYELNYPNETYTELYSGINTNILRSRLEEFYYVEHKNSKLFN